MSQSTQSLPQRRRRRLRAERSHRTLHLLDLENLLGGRVTDPRCQRVWEEYRSTVGIGAVDQVVVAVSVGHAAVAAFGLPSGIVRMVLGANVKDGADRALVEDVDAAHVARRFERVVIASGDHYFAPLAGQLRVLGCELTQVTGAAQFVAAALWTACHTNLVLPIHHDPRAG